ncbi:biopolymer transport protein ExbD [Celeribacter baekdonensis]|uniref:Biopolymer transport protein ExbD n=1 Tax=Celeribacter baekdonensis TaxID=875171 RepID=A0A1G7HTH0_9RHOB|nr:biopolymer transporter ExbD [Celeribacter baekdonensis]SDF03777.1 biopolymer transport protein ExbD [Celeribacter baekdonensis]
MNLSGPPRKRVTTGLLPMINVVFLLLIFFLIAGEMQPPEPFDITPPEITPPDITEAQEAEGVFALFLDPSGQLAYRDQITSFETRQAILSAIDTERRAGCDGDLCDTVLLIHADKSTPAHFVAQLLPQLGALGFEQVNLVTSGLGTSKGERP